MKLLLIAVFLLILIAIFVILIIKIKNKNKDQSKIDEPLSDDKTSLSLITYSLSKKILSDAEYSFYKSLILIAPQDILIFSKVRISDIISVTGPKNAGNKINQKHFDFCIFDKKNPDILMVIELDDKSHNSKKVKDRDLFVDEVCAQAKLKILHIPAAYSYSTDELRSIFMVNIKLHSN